MDSMLLDVKVVSIHRLADGKVKAFADVQISDALLIKGVRVVEGRNGLFVSMPSELGKNERWYERVQCLNNDIRTLISQRVMDAYLSADSNAI